MRSIEFKIILSIVLFTLFIVGLERYQLSENFMDQFIKSKESKNNLLMRTVSPVVGLNLSLGLTDSYKEYLDQIAHQNSDLIAIKLVDAKNETLYEYRAKQNVVIDEDKNRYNYGTMCIVDELTDEQLATIEMKFSNREHEEMISRSRDITINISIITLVLLALFIFYLKLEFRHLKRLTNDVLTYDPKLNNFPLKSLEGTDEVSLIHNAIISMVKKISVYTDLLDRNNVLLEEKVAQRTLELEKSNRELSLLASVDYLSKLYNRRHFTQTAEAILEMSKRNNTKVSIIMIDIDNFKSINDAYGHETGDEVIVSFSSIIKESIRKSDVACRFGGEEFIVLFPDTDVDGAFSIAEKIRKEAESRKVYLSHNQELNYTVSVGVSEVDMEKDRNMEASIHRADSAMYRAKNGGRNNTCIESE